MAEKIINLKALAEKAFNFPSYAIKQERNRYLDRQKDYAVSSIDLRGQYQTSSARRDYRNIQDYRSCKYSLN